MVKKKLLSVCVIGVVAVVMLAGCGSKKDTGITDTEAITQSSIQEDETVADEILNAKDNKNEKDENGVVLGDYSNFTYTRDYTKPTDADVEETIQEILESNVKGTLSKKGTVKDGDTINVTFKGTADGVEMDNLSGKNLEVALGKDLFYKEFEKGIVGHKVGETFKITFTYPKDYEIEDVAGKDAVFEVTVNGIMKYSETPELTDKWVKENSKYDSVEAYKKGIKDGLVAQANELADSDAIYQLISQLYSVSYADVSEDETVDAMEEELLTYKETAEQMDMPYEDYVKNVLGMQVEDFENNLITYAESNMENQKILNAFIEKENVDVSDEAFKKYLDNEATIYGYESGDEILSEMESTGYDNYIRDIFIEYQAGMKLMEISTLVDTEVATEAADNLETENVTEISNVSETETSITEEIITLEEGEEFSIELAETETELPVEVVVE